MREWDVRRRILLTGIRIITRAKRRAIVFVILFTFISGLMLFSLNFVWDAHSTTLLVQSKGIILRPKGFTYVSYDENLEEKLARYDDVEKVVAVWFVNLSELEDLGVNAIMVAVNPDNKWCYVLSESFDLSPSSLREGDYIAREGEIMLSSANVLNISKNTTVSLRPSSILKIGKYSFHVVGMLSEDKLPNGGMNWIIAHESDVKRICEKYGLQKYVFGYIVIVEGWLFSGWDNVERVGILLKNEYKDFEVIYASANDNYRLFSPMIVLFAFSVFGCLIVGALFSYLDIRLRKRSLAILRSLGWSTGNLRLLTLAELLFVTILGFFFGLLALAIYRLFTAQIYVPLSVYTVLISFVVIMVSTQVPGGYLYQRSITKVKPVDALRLIER